MVFELWLNNKYHNQTKEVSTSGNEGALVRHLRQNKYNTVATYLGYVGEYDGMSIYILCLYITR